MNRRTLPVAASAVFLLAACGTQVAGDAGPNRSGGTSSTIPAECPDGVADSYPDYAAGPHLADDQVPVAVLRCVVAQEDDPATGRWTVVRTEKATAGIDAYVAALRMADAPRPEGDFACTADALLLPWSAVVLADGTAVQVALPVDACDKPIQEVRTALDALTFATVSTERVRQDASADDVAREKQAESLGCAYQFKDLIRIEAQDGPDSGKQPLLATTPNRMTSCRYSADPASDDPVLTFVGGGRALAPQEVDTAVAALQTATPTTEACTTPHTVVWGLYGADAGPWLLVELDGCGRVASDTGALRTLPPASLAELQAVLEATAG